jgi:hypothetical protein
MKGSYLKVNFSLHGSFPSLLGKLHNVVIPDLIRNPGFSVKLVLDLIGEREHSSVDHIIHTGSVLIIGTHFSLIPIPLFGKEG